MGYILLLLGVFFFFNSHILMGIVIGIIGLYIIGNKEKCSQKGDSLTKNDRLLQYYYGLQGEIFEQCFDERTAIFNFNIWFDRRDEIIHSAPTEVLQHMDSDFKYAARM